MNATFRRTALLSLALPLVLSACDREDPGAPAEYEPASVGIALSFPASLSGVTGLEEAYLKTDRLWLQFRDEQSTARDERQVDFQPSVQDSHVPLSIRLRSAREAFTFNVEVRLGSAGVFRGTAPVTLRAGRLTSVTATLTPILAGVVAPDTVPVLTAWGDTVRLAAAGILATGDTLANVPIDWTALDPGVATIDAGGKVLGKMDGTARMVASSGSFADTATVHILAQVASVSIQPDVSDIPLYGTRQFTATLRDRNGNTLPTRPVTWTSSNPAAITIDANGVATGVNIGASEITAAIGGSTGTAEAMTVPIAPRADSMKALVMSTSTATISAIVYANGAPTQGWFEWGSPQLQTLPSVILPLALGSSLQAVPLSTTLNGLLPNTLYYAVAHAMNSAGSAISDTVWFSTAPPPPNGNEPIATTVSWTSIGQPNWVEFTGSVETRGFPTNTWFEWGTDPALQGAQKTAVQSATTAGGVVVKESAQMPFAGTYYFRFVAQNGNGTSYGAILSLTLTPKPPGAPSVNTNPATNVVPDGARLNGDVNPKNVATTGHFDWGTNPTLGTYTSTPTQSFGNVSATIPVTFDLSALMPNMTYYFRMTATNSLGTSVGSILSFTTPVDPNVKPPAVTTDNSTHSPTLVTLNGTVDPMGSTTTVWFEWALASSPSNFVTTPQQVVGAGNVPLAFSAQIPRSTEGVFRAVARNAGGTVYGALVTFQF